MLREKSGDEYVVLHLICQGAEIICKALLLMKDFDANQSRLRSYSHGLEKLFKDTLAEYGLAPPRAKLDAEIKTLSQWFESHALRYGLPQLIFIDAKSIRSDRVLARISAVIQLANREFKRSGRFKFEPPTST